MIQGLATTDGVQGLGHEPFRPAGHALVEAYAVNAWSGSCLHIRAPATTSPCMPLPAPVHGWCASTRSAGPHEWDTAAHVSSMQLGAVLASPHSRQAYMLRVRDCLTGGCARSTATQQEGSGHAAIHSIV